MLHWSLKLWLIYVVRGVGFSFQAFPTDLKSCLIKVVNLTSTKIFKLAIWIHFNWTEQVFLVSFYSYLFKNLRLKKIKIIVNEKKNAKVTLTRLNWCIYVVFLHKHDFKGDLIIEVIWWRESDIITSGQWNSV